MIIQFEILTTQANRILAVLPSLGFVYDPNLTTTEDEQKWDFLINMTLLGWDNMVFNYERSLAIANEPNDSAAAQSIRYEIIKDEILSENEKPWVADESVDLGVYRTYGGNRYIVVQAHTTQLGWEPPNVPALFSLKNPPDAGQQYPNWVQPLGAQDAYALGDRVRHNSQNWESTLNSNVWEPGVFGWVVI